MIVPPDLALHVSAFFIVFARVGAVLMLLPVFGEDAIPGRIRLFIAFAMSAAMYGLIGAPARMAVEAGAILPAVLVTELITGLAMGMIVKILFFAISMAGSLISMQIGLSAAVMFDPSQSGQAPILSKLVGLVAALTCMGMQVHHLWLGAIVHSYQSFPIGGMPPMHDFAELAVQAIERSMTLGISLAAPFLVYGIVFNVALGLAARVAPAIQVFFIAQPLNLLLGIALTITTIGTILTFFTRAMGDAMQGGW
ncbi:flagellar biosynthetic protein FliR [Sphingomonas sp. HT-1]|uniref:flagellar biosynthetic protein FliR n=1 Tax=unclassified Sphingomonas TaxID=196159 RepID=UPI0002DBDCEE|nr:MULTISPECIES: flagellar biosynthetic protein FliR [unclassified Sphingomonas]KTF70608.1 flagellar biosynthetic protein FliR [Sphingomonas sp. WG]